MTAVGMLLKITLSCAGWPDFINPEWLIQQSFDFS
ncbi:hypothetical protein SAMN05660748_4234 [Blastococcus aggregatus]|uniref:Uncharacterized protein n=1 Tax=Blastococcus aggregatus TaxID=38502 RepID=A0A285VFK5_9ACTN|nr:hypothetical protein SAMN05660748_4234 [Blastococcus aggregatus]